VPALLAHRPAKEKLMGTSSLRCAAAASLCSLLGCLSPAQAQTMLVQSAGSFAIDAPLTPFSSPGGLWSLSFTLDRQPLLEEGVEAYREGAFTTPQFATFEYRLNGELLPEASFVILYSVAWLGGMELIFGGIPVGTPYGYNALQFFGDAYYSGSEQTPTIEAGSYATFQAGRTGVEIAFEGRTYMQPATTVTISAVPAPPSLALMMAGLTALAVYKRAARHSMRS
jgi:hypothetical protein